jgi:hypothetical protein
MAAVIQSARVHIEPVTEIQARLARDAYRDFGKGSGHLAKLNFGDCFAYALARPPVNRCCSSALILAIRTSCRRSREDQPHYIWHISGILELQRHLDIRLTRQSSGYLTAD